MSDAAEPIARASGALPARAPRRSSVRLRLLALALLPTLILLPALLSIGAAWWASQIDRLLISKVNSDLTVAREYLNRLMEHMGDGITAVARSGQFERLLAQGQPAPLDDFLNEKRKVLGLDFLVILGPGGSVLASSPKMLGPLGGSMIDGAVSGRETPGFSVISQQELYALSPEFAERAHIELVRTEAAVPNGRQVEDRGLMIHAASRIAVPNQAPPVLLGGSLLNQNLGFIDTINDLIYRAASLPAGSQGTATIFLDDVRVSTNVRLFSNARALGTRVSAAVRHAVLEEGQIWLDRAFVVNDWYVSAYEPLADGSGRRAGMLYVGFLEKPFREAKQQMLLTLIGAFLAVTAITTPLLLKWARSVFSPLERMNSTIEQIDAGDLGARTRLEGRNDEIGRVAIQLDQLLDGVQQRDQALRAWANELDARVAARTAELKGANERLAAAQRQLVMSEKLAAIGEITAGVAHEINNPIAVIQGNLDVARELLGADAERVRPELALIEQQVHRMNLIVTKLLQFAKPEEFAGYTERITAGPILDDSLVLVRNQLGRSKVRIERRDLATRSFVANRTELQQVVINLVVNAIHAMPDGGTLTLQTRDADHERKTGTAIDVIDTGIGIAPENLERIFNAFFTTRPQRGTGLGLSISATLLARYGGSISVASEVGNGSTFTVWLPEASAVSLDGHSVPADTAWLDNMSQPIE